MKVVESMAKHANNGAMRVPIETLEEAIQDIKNGDINPDKILILSLTTKNDTYRINFHQGGMKMSECITLCEISKQVFLNEMGYSVFSDEI